MKLRTISAVATWIVVIAASGAAQDTSSSILSRVDHLIYATPDLDMTVAEMERLLGVKAAPGGQQQGRGTKNAPRIASSDNRTRAQTFCDVCRAHASTGRELFGRALW